MTGSKPLRRTRADLVATAAITLLTLGAVGVVYAQADINKVSFSRDVDVAGAPASLESAPRQVHEEWRYPAAQLRGTTKPVVVSGLTMIPLERGVSAVNAAGTEVWRYERADRELCQLMGAWDKVNLVFRGPAGCGEVVSLNGADGGYEDTRSTPAPERPLPIVSNSRVGILSPERVELWRADMVRTVEYGEVPAKQEPDLQPHEDCTLSSAATRTELLALTETCPDDPETTWLRFQPSTPKEARKPEVESSVELEEGSRIVAISQEAAAIYVPSNPPQLRGYHRDGRELFHRKVKPSPSVPAEGEIFAAHNADLPHAISWFDGERLYLLHPTHLDVIRTFEDAIGTGVAVGDQFVYPTKKGLSVADASSGKHAYSIALRRGDTPGPIGLAVAGDQIIEYRGDAVVGLSRGKGPAA